LPTLELLRRAKQAGYDGNKSAFYGMVAGLRPATATPIVRFEGLPGEFSQHDFGEVHVRFVCGLLRRVLFFVSRLKFSRFAQLTIVPNQRVETLVRCLCKHFVAFGGLPLLAVFDRPKTIVVQGGKGRDVVQWNAAFAQAMIAMGVGVEMCAPRSGNQKGAAENLVGWAKGSFFKPRRFRDEYDLDAQLVAWHEEGNLRRPNRATGVIPETLRHEELPRLRPINVLPAQLALRLPIVVGPTAEVTYEGVRYSMPPKATNLSGTLFLYEDRVRIVAGRFAAEHRRRTKHEPKAPLPEHRSAFVGAVHGARAKLYAKRQHLLDLQGDAERLLTEIVHRDPSQAADRVEALHALLEQHGDDALHAAIARAVAARDFTVDAVRAALCVAPARGHARPRAGATQPRGPSALRTRPHGPSRAASNGGSR
jgi:hypothetical protein